MLNRSNSFSSIFKILGGGALGQAFGFLLLPLITREYSPSSIGQYGIYTSIITVLAIVYSMRYEFAIGSAVDGDEVSIVSAAIWLALACMLLSYFLIIIGHFCVPSLLENRFYVYFLPLGGFFAAILQILSFYSIKLQNFNSIAASKGIYGFSIAILQALLGAFFQFKGSLIVSHSIGQIFSAIVIFPRILLAKLNSPLHYIGILVKYSRAAIYLTPAGVINAMSVAVPIFVIGSRFGNEFAGMLAISQRVFATPLDLVGTSIGQVFSGKIMDRKIENSVKIADFALYSRILLAIGVLTVGCAILMARFSGLFLGEKWTSAGEIFLPVSLIYIARLFGNTFAQSVVLARKERLILIVDIFRAIAILMAFLLAKIEFVQLVHLYSLIMVGFYVVSYWLAYSSTKEGVLE
ncbi:lipopolysaccharide biosynthesis protein [Deinococcus frigens]|uniref:lipopolysaccharide biosynthesis protein n=1 Tax=Deinococcus frigens TaxID=249403 RepID=UPI0012EB394D|nr:hypothetical protein [Deinococcus frigens]